MARIDNLMNYLTDVGSAIKEKRKINENIPASIFDDEIRKIQGDIFDLDNDNIQSTTYKVKENASIQKGDFVKFVNNEENTNDDIYNKFTLDNTYNNDIYNIIKIADNKFLALRYIDSKMYVSYLTIIDNNNHNIENTMIYNGSFGTCSKMIKISEQKILLLYYRSSSYKVAILSIDESNNITFSNETSFYSSGSYASGYNLEVTELENKQYFCCISKTSSDLGGIVIKIDENNNIILGTLTNINSNYGTAGSPIKILKISNTDVIIMSRTGSDSDSYLLAFRRCSINDMTITGYSYKDIRNIANYEYNAINSIGIVLNSNLLYVICSYGSNYDDYKLLGRLISFELQSTGISFTVKNSIIFSSVTNTSRTLSPIINLNGGNLLFIHSTGETTNAMEGIIYNFLTQTILKTFLLDINISSVTTKIYFNILFNKDKYIIFGSIYGWIFSNILFSVEKINYLGEIIIGLALENKQSLEPIKVLIPKNTNL